MVEFFHPFIDGVKIPPCWGSGVDSSRPIVLICGKPFRRIYLDRGVNSSASVADRRVIERIHAVICGPYIVSTVGAVLSCSLYCKVVVRSKVKLV